MMLIDGLDQSKFNDTIVLKSLSLNRTNPSHQIAHDMARTLPKVLLGARRKGDRIDHWQRIAQIERLSTSEVATSSGSVAASEQLTWIPLR
jgi:hypothetical protein